MKYGVKKVQSFDEWKKEKVGALKNFATDEEMIFPAMLALCIGGSGVTAAMTMSNPSIPALALSGAATLYGLTHTSGILLGNIEFDEVKEKISKFINKHIRKESVEKEEEHTRTR